MKRKIFVVGLLAASLPIAGLAAEKIYPRTQGSVSASESKDQISHHGADHYTSGPKETYPCSYYAAVVKEPFIEREPISEDQTADVCIIGAGLTGISTALNLRENSEKSVIVLESKRVSWNASGRNGGFAIPGFQIDAIEMEEIFGTEIARKYYKMTLDGALNVKKQIEKYKIQCDFQDHGYMELSTYKTPEVNEEEVKEINKRLGTSFEFWNKEKTRKNYKTDFYQWGLLDNDAFIVNPLGLTLGLARAAESNGAKIYENSPAIKIEENQNSDSNSRFIVHTKGVDGKSFRISCNNVVLAGSCHINSSLNWKIARATSPLFTYIGVTKPLSQESLDSIISSEASVYSIADDTTEINYFRITPDKRLLWGTFAQSFERNHSSLKKDITSVVSSVFPNFKDKIDVEYVWGGDVAMTRHQGPLIGKIQQGYYYATGFGGHGVVPTNATGLLISNAIISNDDSFVEEFNNIFPVEYVGWPCDRFFVQGYIFYEKLKEIITKKIS